MEPGRTFRPIKRSFRGENMDVNKYVPKFKIKAKDLLHIADLSTEEIFELLYAAKAMKKKA